jgi:superfamily II DNA or RNA helicase
MKLIKRTEIEKPEIVYNLHVEKNHNYVANSVVVSNCHGSKASILQNLLTVHGNNIVHRYGLTGTLPEEPIDKLNVHVALGRVVHEVSAAELIEKGWLATPDITIVQLNDVQYMLGNGVKDPYSLMYEEEEHFFKVNAVRLQCIADLVISARQPGKVSNTLILVNTIKYGKDLHSLIPNSYVLNGSDKVKVRNTVYDLFETNDDMVVICTKQIAGVGLSIDRIFNLVYIDAGKSFINTIQQIGRGLRKSADKESVNIIDICSNLSSAAGRMKKRTQFYKNAGYPYKRTTLNYEKKDIN